MQILALALVMSTPDNNHAVNLFQDPVQVISEESTPSPPFKESSSSNSDSQEFTLYQPSQTDQCELVQYALAVREGKLMTPTLLLFDDPLKQTKNGLMS